MRSFVPMRVLAAGALLAPVAVQAAEPQAQVTVDDIVCRYTGECEADASQAKEEAPTRGFSFQPHQNKPKATTPSPAAAPAQAAARPASRPTAPVRPAPRKKAEPAPKPTIGVSRNDLLVSFRNNSYELTDQAKANIRVFAQALKTPQLSDRKFEISGHTNATGSASYNEELSRERAASVAKYLEELQVDTSRLVTKGYGFQKPLPDRNATAPENRRVEAAIIVP